MDPIKSVEDRKAQQDLGVFGARIFQGAYDESDDLARAFFVTIAFFRGLLGSSNDGREENDD